MHDAALIVHHAGAKTNLLPFPGNQVRGIFPPNLFPLDLEEQCHGFRPVVAAAEVEPRQLVIACKQTTLHVFEYIVYLAPNHPRPQVIHAQARALQQS